MSNAIEQMTPVFAYYRLSKDDGGYGESASISNQRNIVKVFCENNGYVIAGEFLDDGYTGTNFNRPDFKRMISELEKGEVKTVITKDSSRLGRSAAELLYFIETYFPENGINYITVSGDVDRNSPLLSIQQAVNELVPRETSRKVKDVKKNKRERGEYCACPPYGYRKKVGDIGKLVPDENTAPIVQRIFREAVLNQSVRKIAEHLNADGIMPPLMYRVINGGKFCEAGAARASDWWNYTTVKRILRNQVYLGHTILGKSEKVSFKSTKKRVLPEEEWAVTKNTHEALVSEDDFWIVQGNLKKKTKSYQDCEHVRKSIFSGLVFCEQCGAGMSSVGTVYKGERKKYWYLECNKKRGDIAHPCVNGARIYYYDLLDIIKSELNPYLALSDNEIDKIVKKLCSQSKTDKIEQQRKKRISAIDARLKIITESIRKVYTNNASGLIDDEQMKDIIVGFKEESDNLKNERVQLNNALGKEETVDNYKMFFDMIKKHSVIDTLDRETVVDFIDRIEVGPKILPEGMQRATHRNSSYEQSIKIYYKFVGELPEIKTT